MLRFLEGKLNMIRPASVDGERLMTTYGKELHGRGRRTEAFMNAVFSAAVQSLVAEGCIQCSSGSDGGQGGEAEEKVQQR